MLVFGPLLKWHSGSLNDCHSPYIEAESPGGKFSHYEHPSMSKN